MIFLKHSKIISFKIAAVLPGKKNKIPFPFPTETELRKNRKCFAPIIKFSHSRNKCHSLREVRTPHNAHLYQFHLSANRKFASRFLTPNSKTHPARSHLTFTIYTNHQKYIPVRARIIPHEKNNT